ncbi:23S rRNA (adenine(1618)-N(6))-methyltransferase RlmF [Ulvibacter litoralis]|uniref:Ribosomal RNA large subunit methyltransferase F n=1 Tax=Ulvibacter litoralis TaxID=227084 RepID=A0A1G7FEP5_9FLAO|nr:23S rRNA (adenine(1618)-N(6))-methyltransferase RlmF [Ulvibacter litoralis]GHC51455.1 ribosomal RNA large subunit methyltransferase F [Ulvibacter litoralis]SDE74362.1 23S rRNA (adenine1618-N6)-methyltransferase [Ulvibacter litoralis]
MQRVLNYLCKKQNKVHPNNLHNDSYNFDALCKTHPALTPFVFVNEYDTQTIDFADSDAVLELNKALLKKHYKVTDWSIPKGYLCPPIPGRADYIHYIADLLAENNVSKPIKGLDIGVGANCIYPILANRIYGWKMVGADCDEAAIASAKKNVHASEGLEKHIDIRQQHINANIFEGIIAEKEYFHFTICNPPFHTSEEAATKGTLRKLKNLHKDDTLKQIQENLALNFGGQANELWCNGGEALFIKRMIKQSASFKTQVGWFTTLVSKKENLSKIYKQLDKLKATHQTIKMEQGNKQSRIVAWTFS